MSPTAMANGGMNGPHEAGASKNEAARPAHQGTEASAFAKTHIAAGIGRMTDYVMKSGKGCRVTLDDGRELLDMTCGIGVTNLGALSIMKIARSAADTLPARAGHCHPVVSEAAAKQCMELVHGQCNIAFHEPGVQLMEALLPLMPDKSLDTLFF